MKPPSPLQHKAQKLPTVHCANTGLGQNKGLEASPKAHNFSVLSGVCLPGSFAFIFPHPLQTGSQTHQPSVGTSTTQEAPQEASKADGGAVEREAPCACPQLAVERNRPGTARLWPELRQCRHSKELHVEVGARRQKQTPYNSHRHSRLPLPVPNKPGPYI